MGKTAKLSVFLLWIFIRRTVFAVSFNNPGTVNLNENDDAGRSLWDVSSTCYPSNNNYIDVLGVQIFTGTTTHIVPCEACTTSSNPDSGLFYLSGNTVRKRSCSDTSCGACPLCTACSTSNGCLTGPATYNIVVRCYTTSYDNDDGGTSTLTVSVAEETPTLTISLPGRVNADNSMSGGQVLTTVDKSSGPDIVQYTKSSPVSNTYLLNTANMFELNTVSGEVYVATDPSEEYDYTFIMGICIHSRRQTSCRNLTINFDGCFQTPNCKDQTGSFSDQHGIGATLFSMIYDPPSDHFNAINPMWQNLSFEEVSSTLAEASIDPTKGVLSTTGNVTVWPNYPNSTHTFVVRVNNPGHSCSYTATCTMTMQFSFTNWPIRLVSLPTTIYIHEDTDSRRLVHSILTYDYNNPNHDNVTCTVTHNEDTALLELTNNGNFLYDSWFIYKKACLGPGCGYVQDNFLCDEDIGCMNYDVRRQINITIQCNDAYGSSDTETFMLDVTENQPPVFKNTPTTVMINKEDIVNADTVFVIHYSDNENEELVYNFTVHPPTPAFLAFDINDNYSNNPAKITFNILASQRKSLNGTFIVSFCGMDRRNIVCSNITINISVPDNSEDMKDVEEPLPIVWLILIVTLVIVIVIACVLVVYVCRLRKNARSLKDASNERNNSSNTQGAELDVRREVNETEYLELQTSRNQGHIYDGHGQVARSQDIDIDVTTGRREIDQGGNGDEYYSGEMITGRSDDYQNTTF